MFLSLFVFFCFCFVIWLFLLSKEILIQSTSDNITVAQEAIHSLSKKKGKNSIFVLKVNLEKAYDRIEWEFLRKVVDCSGFTHILVIWLCIAPPQLSLQCVGMRKNLSISHWQGVFTRVILCHPISLYYVWRSWDSPLQDR